MECYAGSWITVELMLEEVRAAKMRVLYIAGFSRCCGSYNLRFELVGSKTGLRTHP
jgi:hypothetical protein